MVKLDAKDDELRVLLDQQELASLVTRVCRAVDRCDEELLLSCYHPDAIDDHGSVKGSPTDLLAHLRKATMDPARGPVQHSVTNMLFDVRGDEAWGESYVESRVVMPDGTLQVGMGRYVDRYQRRQGEWRIAHRRVILEASRPGFDTSDFVQGRRDRTDPSYER